MAQGNTSAFLLFFIISFNTLFTLSNVSATDQTPKNVLLLTSYHQGDRWNDSVVQGIRDTLGSHRYVNLSIENLDMRRYTGPNHIKVIKEYIRAKYHSRPQDLILVCDDPALTVLLNVREDIFPDAPVVFCGINNFTQSRIQGQPDITGVNEALSLDATLELGLQLFPKTTRVLAVVSDTEPLGRTNLLQYRAVADRMKDRVQFGELLNMTEKEAPDILSHLPKDCLILRLINILKPEGGYLSIEDSIRMIATHAPVPVLTPWSFDLGDGALGGYVSSGLGQGRVAGNLAIRILDGHRAEQIPVVMESPNTPMFDYKLMGRFGIKESDLPEGSVVLNRQVSMLEQYWGWLLGIALFCSFQTVLILALLTRGKRLHAANSALRESEERFSQLAKQSRTFTWEVDTEGRYTFVSNIVKDVLGYEPEELVGKLHFYDLHPEGERETFKLAAFEVFARKEQFRDLINVVHCKTGETRWVSTNGIPLLDIDGKLSGYRGSDTDISERKQAEEALFAERNRLAGVIEGTRTGTWEWNVQTGETVFNARWAEIIGYTLEELSPVSIETWMKFAHPDDLKKSSELLEAHFRGELDYYEFEARIRHKNGEWFWVLDRGRVVSWTDGGKPLIMMGTHQNITERKLAEEAIKTRERMLSGAVEMAKLGYWELDIDSGMFSFSDSFYAIFRVTAREVGGYQMSIADYASRFVHPDDAYMVGEETRKALETKDPNFSHYLEHRMLYTDGSIGHIAVRFFVTNDITGKTIKTYGVNQDITERKRAEEENKILNAQLQQAQRLEAIGTLAGGIAHDFNNILGAIVGYSEMIRDDLSPNSPSIHDINQVLKASYRAKDLVKQILAFSRQIEEQKIPIQPAVIIKEAISLLRSSLPTTISIKQDIDAEAGMVLADPTQIHQVVMNLATNAFHAMEVKGGTLTICLQKRILFQADLTTLPDLQPGAFAQLSVRDTGEGILPEIREKIFDPFFTTKEVGRGTGLGLSMVYSIVKSCNGSIACDSRVGEGTEFRILLPILEGHSAEENEEAGLTPHGKEHILLVDDEEMLAELGQAMLERLDYHVTTRGNSLDALTTFQNQPDAFDLIITDQTMPGMTGVDLARRILQLRPGMPIILCTGYSSQISEQTGKAAGIKGFAYKPLAKKEIGELIRKVLDKKNP